MTGRPTGDSVIDKARDALERIWSAKVVRGDGVQLSDFFLGW